MVTTYSVYRNGSKIASDLTEKTYTDTGLDPDTEYTYQVSAENEYGESELSDPVALKTLPVSITGVSVSPVNSSAEAGTAGSRQLTVTVEPENATNKNVSFMIEPSADGLTVSDTGLIEWTEETPAGVYTTTVTTVDGGYTAQNTLTLTEPEDDDPDPIDGE